jgi:SAM-dependent methyltransferase
MKKIQIPSGVDFGKTAGDYGRYRQGFPPAYFDRLATLGIGLAGQRFLDLGTGTGALARALAVRGCVVTGLDRSPALLEEAARLDREAGVEITYVQASAEETGLADGGFQGITAAQCWHWFDGKRAAREAHRLLGPGGAIVIAGLDWVATPANVVDATEALIEHHNPAWTLRGAESLAGAPYYFRQLAVAGFQDLESFSFDVLLPYTHEAWRGRIRASAGVGATLPPDAIARFDDELRQLLARDYPADPILVPHRATALIGRRHR